MPRKPAAPDWPAALIQWMSVNAWSAAELARHLSISARSVHRWLSGASVPDPATAARLTRLGAPPSPAMKRGTPSHEPIRESLERIEAKLDRLLEVVPNLGLAAGLD